jgi:hypothetical protein
LQIDREAVHNFDGVIAPPRDEYRALHAMVA